MLKPQKRRPLKDTGTTPHAQNTQVVPTEDDIAVAAQLIDRAQRTTLGGLGLGALAFVLSLVPTFVQTMPGMVYGIVSVGPAVFGAVAVAAALSGPLGLTHIEPGIQLLIKRRRTLLFGVAVLAIALGLLGASLGLLSARLVQVMPLLDAM